MMAIRITMKTVPKMAGKTPPVFASRGVIGLKLPIWWNR